MYWPCCAELRWGLKHGWCVACLAIPLWTVRQCTGLGSGCRLKLLQACTLVLARLNARRAVPIGAMLAGVLETWPSLADFAPRPALVLCTPFCCCGQHHAGVGSVRLLISSLQLGLSQAYCRYAFNFFTIYSALCVDSLRVRYFFGLSKSAVVSGYDTQPKARGQSYGSIQANRVRKLE